MNKQKSVLITGSSTGIGQATAIHLARCGYHVFASMRNPSTGAGPLLQMAEKESLPLEVIPLNVTDPDSSARAVETILEKVGKIDVLVNNAGISGGGPVEELTDDVLRRTFETNFFGAVRMMRLVIPAMRQARSGAIVNISSVVARWITAGSAGYCASKVALEAASEAAAQELRRFNISVMLIEPGYTMTPIFEKKTEGMEGVVVPSDSPYAEFSDRAGRQTAELLPNGSPPELVAETIQHALEEKSPKFRYPVGEDAKRIIAGRQGISDEDWIDSGREMTLDDYADFFHNTFGLRI